MELALVALLTVLALLTLSALLWRLPSRLASPAAPLLSPLLVRRSLRLGRLSGRLLLCRLVPVLRVVRRLLCSGRSLVPRRLGRVGLLTGGLARLGPLTRGLLCRWPLTHRLSLRRRLLVRRPALGTLSIRLPTGLARSRRLLGGLGPAPSLFPLAR